MLATKPPKRAKLRHNEYYNLQDSFDALYKQSKQGHVFAKLLPLIACENNILLAYRNIKRNKGSNTPGTDAVTIHDIERLEATDYVDTIKRMLMNYSPKPVRRKEIPKPNGKLRPLGIPSIWDRLFQQCILQVLEPICEAKFHDRSNGFRPNRSAEHAIAQCHNLIQLSHMYFVVDIDIKGFFDNVNHTRLIQQLWTMGIRDKSLLCIIRRMLKAPIVMPDGKVEYPVKGTPQGGILSPLLSNVVLNELDWWVDSNWESFPMRHPVKEKFGKTGNRCKSHEYRSLRRSNLKEMYIVRYADDFKIFCPTRNVADRTYTAVKLWLKERLRLDISEEKSKITNLKKQYTEFLGFRLKAVPRRDSFVVKSHVCDKAIERIKSSLKTEVVKIEHAPCLKQACIYLNKYNLIVMGTHNYYRIATMANSDFAEISYELNAVIRNRLRCQMKKDGDMTESHVLKQYGKSKQIRFVNGRPLLPIGYPQAKHPCHKKASINAYTPEGRTEIHKKLGISTAIVHALMLNYAGGQSIEFLDNRLSLYCAQYGKCAVTGRILGIDDIHCHHKLPVSSGGKDSYQNLVILNSDVHRLVHATVSTTVRKYVKQLMLDSNALQKVNKFRKLVGNDAITVS